MLQKLFLASILQWWRTLTIIVQVYFIGFYYFIYECLIDCKFIKLSEELCDFNELKETFNRDLALKEETEKKQRVLVITGGNGTIGRKVIYWFLYLEIKKRIFLGP